MNNLYLNGAYMPVEEGRVSVEDRGFQFGDGVYEVIRIYGGSIFRLRTHLERLERSLVGLEIPLPHPLSEMEEVCRRVSTGLDEAMIYLQVTRGATARVHAFPEGMRPTFVAYAREVPPRPADRAFKLLSLPDDRWGRCDLKTVCLLSNILGKRKAIKAGCDEGLFVRDDGTVTEGTSSNAFFVRRGALLTHPVTNRILNGATREVVLALAREAHIPVEERPCTLREALEADEAFVTGTITEITPAVSLDGGRIGTGSPGPVTQQLRAAFDAQVRRECRNGKKGYNP